MSRENATARNGRDSQSKPHKESTFKRLSNFGHHLGHRVSSKESSSLRSSSALSGNRVENEGDFTRGLDPSKKKDERTLEANMRNFTFGIDPTENALPRLLSGSLSPFATMSHVTSDTNTNVSGGSATIGSEERRPSAISTGSDESSNSVGRALTRKMASLTDRQQKDLTLGRTTSVASGGIGPGTKQPTLTRQQSNEAPPADVVPFLYQNFDDLKELGEAPIHSSPVDGRTQALVPNGGAYVSTQDEELRRLASAYHARMTRNFTEDEKDKKKKGFGRFRKKGSNEVLPRIPSINRPSSVTYQAGSDTFRKASASDTSTLDSSQFSFDTFHNPPGNRKTSRFSNGRVSTHGSLHGSVGRPRQRGGEQSSNLSHHLDTNPHEVSDVVATPRTSRAPISPLTTWEDAQSQNDKRSEIGWVAPDSWVVRRPDEDVNPRLSDINDEDDLSTSIFDSGKRKNSANKSLHSPSSPLARQFLRVYRGDNTFATVSCALNTTVVDLLGILSRKFFLPDFSNFQLVMFKYNSSRVLSMQEHPLVLQKRVLKYAGYAPEDYIDDIGREDHSYLCRFVFIATNLQHHARQEDANLSKLTRYSHVNLERRNLQMIPVTLYQHAKEIVSLNFSMNLSLEVPSDLIQSCPMLKEIRFSGNELRYLPSCLQRSSHIAYLDLSDNFIEELPSSVAENLNQLINLQMQNNHLKTLPLNHGSLKYLRNLNIASNCLTAFPPSMCELVTLVELDISFNEIESFPNEIGQLCALEKLIATNNRLSGMLPITFSNMSSLKELDLRFNMLSTVDVITELPRLELFYINHNAVSVLEYDFPRLQVLHLEKNPVTRFSIRDIAPTLTTLNLASAKIAAFSETLFDRLPNLRRLILDRNHFVSLSASIGKLRHLQYLSCMSNLLASVPAEIGQLLELRHLDLHNNNIKTLPSEIWQLCNLVTLNISSNLLASLPKPSLKEVAVTPGELSKSASSDELSDSRNLNGLLEEPSTFKALIDLPPPRKSSAVSKVSSSNSGPEAMDNSRKNSHTSSGRFLNTMSASLRNLSAADNRFNDDCFEEISLLTELRVLNLSYNDLFEVPNGVIGRLSQLAELYLSGNELTSLPSDDLDKITALKVLHVNSNKLQTLPAELAKIRRLLVLDVASNSLKYNIANWPYDWNWNWNLDLKYLNLSANKRLEIKPNYSMASGAQQRDISDFAALTKLRVLGLMDVTLTIPSIPDQTEDRRVRTSGSEIHKMSYGMADSLGRNEHLSMIDLVIERFRGREDECIFGLFDGESQQAQGSRISRFLQEGFAFHLVEEMKRLRPNEGPTSALRRTFLALNKELWTTAMLPPEKRASSSVLQRREAGSVSLVVGPDDLTTGCVATVVYMLGSHLYVANVGDAMALIVRNDGELRLLTKKHDPPFEPEAGRIRKAGGWISRTGNVLDKLSVSRTFGHYELMPSIQAAPSTMEVEILDQDDLLIIASNEIWEYLSYQMAVDIARTDRENLMRAAQKLRDFAIAYGATDKLMVMVVGIGDLRKARNRVADVSLRASGLMPLASEDELFLPKKRRNNKDMADDSTLARLEREVSPPVGQVAMIFTDIKNSTLLWETDPIAMRSAIKVHNSIMRRQLRVVGGYEVKTEGDAFMVCFATAASSLLWCFSVQSQLLMADWPHEILDSPNGREVLDSLGNIIFRGLSVRMGIHWGSPVSEIDPITRRMDYFGPMVNRAARICAVADGGQITVSADFVSELERSRQFIENLNETYPKSTANAADEYSMQTIIREMRTLDGIGYDLQHLGERKLKGLENPETITIMYTKSFLGRVAVDQASPSIQGGTQSSLLGNSIGLLNILEDEVMMEFVESVWLCVLRLESLCSFLADGMRDPSSDSALKRFKMRAKVGMYGNELVPLLENTATRLENCISTLGLRAALHQQNGSTAHNEVIKELFFILEQVTAATATK